MFGPFAGIEPFINIVCPDYLQGKVKIDEYVTHHRKFAEINDGFHDMHVSLLPII